MRSFNNVEFISNPSWAQEKLTKTNIDFTAHWTSKLFDHRWQIDALAGIHTRVLQRSLAQRRAERAQPARVLGRQPVGPRERAGLPAVRDADRHASSPAPSTATTRAASAWSRSTPASAGSASSSRPTCSRPAATTSSSTAGTSSTSTFDQERCYSGPLGSRGARPALPERRRAFNSYSFFTLQPGEFPADFGPAAPLPSTDLLQPPRYQDSLKAERLEPVERVLPAGQLQPEGLRNLTINVGARLELQKLYDFHGKAFLDTNNISPRVGAMLRPVQRRASKLSVFYGRYFEAIPLNVAARYFGGEGILIRNGVPFGDCAQPEPVQLDRRGRMAELQHAARPPIGRRRPTTRRAAARCSTTARTTRCRRTAGASTTTRSSPPPSARSSRT